MLRINRGVAQKIASSVMWPKMSAGGEMTHESFVIYKHRMHVHAPFFKGGCEIN